MKLKHLMFKVALSALVFTGCTNDDDDEPIQRSLEVTTGQDSYGEGDGTILINFSTNTTYQTDVTITYEVTGTATSGEDYEALSGTATLPAGMAMVSQNLTILDDDDVESSEELIVTIKTVEGANDLVIGAKDEVTLTITDNDSYPFENGILVSHEGNFGQGNSSISFVSADLSVVENGIFKSVNEVDSWGDTAQSMAFSGDMAYIIVNGSQKIEVVNRYTFESVATIGGPSETDFLNPRYMAIANGKGYVTNWGDGSDPADDFVAVVNLESNEVEAKISVAEGPERIIAKDNMVYVAMQGGYNQNNMVTVIDATANTVSTTVTVGDRPNSLQLDSDGNLWVVSSGNPSWTGNETSGQLNKISTSDNTVAETFNFAQTEHPGYLGIDEGSLYYYLGGSVYEMGTSATELPQNAEIEGLSFYGMAVNQGKLYGVDAKDYSSNGSLEVYDLGNNSLLDSKEVSIIPGEIYFNEMAER